jgi:hypothetical protein
VDLMADERHRQRAKAGVPAMFIYSATCGFLALVMGAVASLAVTSQASKLMTWSIVTGIAALAAGAAYESRWARRWSRLIIHWIQAAQRLYEGS